MFFSFNEGWFFQLVAIFGLVGAVLGFVIGRFARERHLPKLRMAFVLAPPVGTGLWVVLGVLLQGGASLIVLVGAGLFALLLLSLHYVAFWSAGAVCYSLGRRLRRSRTIRLTGTPMDHERPH